MNFIYLDFCYSSYFFVFLLKLTIFKWPLLKKKCFSFSDESDFHEEWLLINVSKFFKL